MPRAITTPRRGWLGAPVAACLDVESAHWQLVAAGVAPHDHGERRAHLDARGWLTRPDRRLLKQEQRRDMSRNLHLVPAEAVRASERPSPYRPQ